MSSAIVGLGRTSCGLFADRSRDGRLRLGEAAGVQLGDVDFLTKSFKVSRPVQRVNGGTIDVRAPKYGSERVIYLSESLVNVLAEHVATHGTTGLIAAGCDVVSVQRSLGHAKASTTINTYAHLWPTAEDRTRKAAESIMSASLGEPAAPLAESGASTGE